MVWNIERKSNECEDCGKIMQYRAMKCDECLEKCGDDDL